MNPLGAFDDQREANPALWPERERYLEEYSQAVHQYQQAVLALQSLDGAAGTDNVRNLLAQADVAREALQQCRNRFYHAFSILHID